MYVWTGVGKGGGRRDGTTKKNAKKVRALMCHFMMMMMMMMDSSLGEHCDIMWPQARMRKSEKKSFQESSGQICITKRAVVIRFYLSEDE